MGGTVTTGRRTLPNGVARLFSIKDAVGLTELVHRGPDEILVETSFILKFAICFGRARAVVATHLFRCVGMLILGLAFSGECAVSPAANDNPFARGPNAATVPFPRGRTGGNILIIRGPPVTNAPAPGTATDSPFARGKLASNFPNTQMRRNTNNPFARGGVVRGQAAESEYWYQFHIKLNRQKERDEQELQRQRADAKFVVPWLIKEGEAMEPEIIAAQNAPPPLPPPPSFFEGHRDYILFGFLFSLVAVVSTFVLARHKREAEIRALTGTYLSDGREIAHFKMPALFEAPIPLSKAQLKTLEASNSTADKKADAPDEEQKQVLLREFFRYAAEQIADMRQALPEVSQAFDEAERKETLLKLHEVVCELKEKANCWDLRPVWQLTSALELLLKRLAEKSKEVTPSTTRTIASAIDLLAELCAPDVRPDLIINPPIAVLAVDDDALCLRAMVFALQKADMAPDVAKNGEEALAMGTEKSYDVVFMDIMMPTMDGLTACTRIHETRKNKTTPVVFVTARTDFRARTESTLVGGVDLMAKPFLMFEITVKALTFAMRKRLDLAESCRRDLAALNALSRAQAPTPPSNVSKSAPTPQAVAA